MEVLCACSLVLQLVKVQIVVLDLLDGKKLEAMGYVAWLDCVRGSLSPSKCLLDQFRVLLGLSFNERAELSNYHY